jgi:acetyltransferase-like isoleucine patch superfamily enzyme
LVGKLIIGKFGAFTNRHYVDCSGQVILRPFAAVAGLRSIILSHELDYAENKTEPGRVVLGSNAVTTVGCILLKDSYLPERSVLAAGSVLPRAKEGVDMPISALYGGPRRVSFESSRKISGGIALRSSRRQYRLTTKSFVWTSGSGGAVAAL